jgi:hypothetical protein
VTISSALRRSIRRSGTGSKRPTRGSFTIAATAARRRAATRALETRAGEAGVTYTLNGVPRPIIRAGELGGSFAVAEVRLGTWPFNESPLVTTRVRIDDIVCDPR